MADQPKWIVVKSGNNQTAPTNTQLGAPLVGRVVDQYSNPVVGLTVTFSDGTAGGHFSLFRANRQHGAASTLYTTGTHVGLRALRRPYREESGKV